LIRGLPSYRVPSLRQAQGRDFRKTKKAGLVCPASSAFMMRLHH
jgi:hypothetical protein